jgi:hypothetical protein
MVQVAALSQTFAAHIAAQAEQIEQLCVLSSALLRWALTGAPWRSYTSAVESTRTLQRGNEDLVKTLERSGGARRSVAILLLMASLLLLLLDWLSG